MKLAPERQLAQTGAELPISSLACGFKMLIETWLNGAEHALLARVPDFLRALCWKTGCRRHCDSSGAARSCADAPAPAADDDCTCERRDGHALLWQQLLCSSGVLAGLLCWFAFRVRRAGRALLAAPRPREKRDILAVRGMFPDMRYYCSCRDEWNCGTTFAGICACTRVPQRTAAVQHSPSAPTRCVPLGARALALAFGALLLAVGGSGACCAALRSAFAPGASAFGAARR